MYNNIRFIIFLFHRFICFFIIIDLLSLQDRSYTSTDYSTYQKI